ncbi:MAG: hypothetical protein LBT59_21550 [Clostridiales bacterium]|jgi:hypothetical protein|nr:hypothetical protein [Clostridiales bacterium]
MEDMITMSVPAFQKLHACKPGQGGIFGGTQGHILDVEYDSGLEAKSFATYKPNYKLWNILIKQWKNYRIGIMGVFHYNSSGQEELTSDDKKFIEDVLSKHKKGSKLHFLHISPKKFSMFAVEMNGDQTSIKSEEFIVVGDLS